MDGAVGPHEPEERSRKSLHDEPETETDDDAQDERLPCQRRRVLSSPRSEGPRHGGGRPRADPAAHRREREERDRKHQ